MNITDINLIDFRNYHGQSVRLCPFVNIVFGANGSGKTNLLEAIYLSAVGRSPRTPRDKEMIRFTKDVARIRVSVKKRHGSDNVDVVIDKSANKRIAIGGLPITRMGELMGVIGVVFFSPDEMRIVKEAPGDRRRFMDIALSQISRNYFYVLSRFNRILSQRNKLLKSGKVTEDSLIPWDIQLAEAGALIIKTRRGFVRSLSEAAAREHGLLTEGKESLTLSYEGIEGGTREEILANYRAALLDSRERDLRLAVTNIGPHKDDIGVFIGDLDARKYGSQGQQRTAALSIKLAEASLAQKESGEAPILLLDDVFGELDKDRQRTLLSRISGMQSVITCAGVDIDRSWITGEYKFIEVKNGQIEVR